MEDGVVYFKGAAVLVFRLVRLVEEPRGSALFLHEEDECVKVVLNYVLSPVNRLSSPMARGATSRGLCLSFAPQPWVVVGFGMRHLHS